MSKSWCWNASSKPYIGDRGGARGRRKAAKTIDSGVAMLLARLRLGESGMSSGMKRRLLIGASRGASSEPASTEDAGWIEGAGSGNCAGG